MQDVIEIDNLREISKSRRVYNFSEYSLPIVFLRGIHERHLSWKDADDEQSIFAAKIKYLDKSEKTIENEFFLIYFF